jgi:hypothetical protein
MVDRSDCMTGPQSGRHSHTVGGRTRGKGDRVYVLLGRCIITGQVDIVRTGSRTDLEVVDDVHVRELWSESSSAPAFTTPKRKRQFA